MFCQDKSAFEVTTDSQWEEAQQFSEGYKTFLNVSKTEREAVSYFVNEAKKSGFVEFDAFSKFSPGDKIYRINRGKGVILAVIGDLPIPQGTNMIAAHIDSPRIDLKQNPLYEENGLAMLKTHYYGGIKKYQWTTIPLALHGVVVTEENRTIEVKIGEDPGDPVFTITDLLPHLAQEQMDKKMSKAIEGEALRILIGSRPSDVEKDKVKNSILAILKEKYDMKEEDFTSAELEIVPAFLATDVGLDRSMVGSYGQDDRVCAYTAFRAMMNVQKPSKTAILALADKEEIGSMGNTGMKSHFFEDTLAQLTRQTSEEYDDLSLRAALGASVCLSADVGAALDPNYKSVLEESNCAQLNHGVLVTKFTGRGGKSGSSDASAELVGYIRRIFNKNGVAWHVGELGKVDLGGGGTVAQYIANLNVDVIDIGVPVLSMHSPFEITGKLDVYMAYRAYDAFYLSSDSLTPRSAPTT